MNNIRFEVWDRNHPRFKELDEYWVEEGDVALVKLQPSKPIEVIWVDRGHVECPEDMFLCRDLSVFVQELQKLTGQLDNNVE